MGETWRHLDTGRGAPGWNMGFDEALLEVAAAHAKPVLRFYAWSEPAATFGYFQKFEDIKSMTKLRPLIRRPTGGGLVPHDSDWTYSLAFPAGHEWHLLRAVESYQRVHEWLRKSFLACGLNSRLSPVSVRKVPGQCFAGAERFDLIWRDRKMAGAAQRRRKDGLLIQGSIQPPGGVEHVAWKNAMLEASREAWGIRWESMPAEIIPDRRAQELARETYEADAFNRRR